jgi:hypothetical protein
VTPDGEPDILLTPLSHPACQKHHGANPEVLSLSRLGKNSYTSEEIQHMRREARVGENFEEMQQKMPKKN